MRITDLFEAPIGDFHHIGDFDKSSSFKHAQDRKLVTAPKALTKIRGMWKYPEETMFNIIFINHADIAGKQSTATHGGKLEEVGIVNKDWLSNNMPRVWDELEPMLRDDQVNVIYTNNSGSERVPMTGWIMAHRLGHGINAANRYGNAPSSAYLMKEAFRESENAFREVMERYRIRNTDYYGKPSSNIPLNGPLLGFLREFCTFRAARENNIRNPYEVIYDWLAQYMLRGSIKCNDIPRGFRYGSSYYAFAGDNDDYEYFNSRMKDDLPEMLESYFDAMLGGLEGKIIVI